MPEYIAPVNTYSSWVNSERAFDKDDTTAAVGRSGIFRFDDILCTGIRIYYKPYTPGFEGVQRVEYREAGYYSDNDYHKTGNQGTNHIFPLPSKMSINSFKIISDRRQRYYDVKLVAVARPKISDFVLQNIKETSLTARANITDTEGETVTERGFSYKKGIDGEIVDVFDTGDFSTGEFSKTITGLDKGEEYYIRASATSPAGTRTTSWLIFSTKTTPVVTTDATPESINATSAKLKGEVIDSDAQEITIVGIEIKKSPDGAIFRRFLESDDFGESEFSITVSPLIPYTDYEYRAYAVNSSGTGYGEWETFKTEEDIPLVETKMADSIESTSFNANGNITNKSGEEILTRGFCYKITDGTPPDINDSVVSEGAGAGDYDLGEYSLPITSLNPSEKYTVVAFAENSTGIGYGSPIDVGGYVFSEGADTYFENFFNKCYIVNGVDDVMSYNGDIIASVGIKPPETAPTGTTDGSDGKLNEGKYRFKYTFVDSSGYESNPSPQSDEIDVGADEHVGLVVEVSNDPKVVKRNIYRTQLGGGIYYYDGEIADNSTTTYVSTKGDMELGSLAPKHNTPPPKGCQLIAKKRNKLFLANKDELCVSYTADVEYFPPAWFIKTGIRQIITSLTEQYDTLPVLTENSIERLIGTDEDNFELSNTWSRDGCIATRSVVICDGLLVYLSCSGIYYYDGTSVNLVSKSLTKYLTKNINKNFIQKASACYQNKLYLLSYPKGNSEFNNETIYIDFINKVSGVYSNGFSCYSKWDRLGDAGRLFAGSGEDGSVYELDIGYFDDKQIIICSDETEYIDFGMPERWKQFYHIYVKVENSDGETLKVEYSLDNNPMESREVEIAKNTTKWYKVDLEGGGQRGRAIKIKPSIKCMENAKFCGYMIVFEPEESEYT